MASDTDLNDVGMEKPRRINFEVLPGLPPYGPMAESFPTTNRVTFSEGFVVRFFPTIGESWVGNFAMGPLSQKSRVVQFPDKKNVVVLAQGVGFWIDPDAHRVACLPGGPYVESYSVGDMLVLCTWTEVLAIGPEGIRWRTERISWDGFDGIKIDTDAFRLHGRCWSAPGDIWMQFSVDLRNGAVFGGAYSFKDQVLPYASTYESGVENPVEYRCSACKVLVPGVAEFCPRCGAILASSDGIVAEYRLPLPRAARITAIVALVVISLMVVFAIVATMFE